MLLYSFLNSDSTKPSTKYLVLQLSLPNLAANAGSWKSKHKHMAAKVTSTLFLYTDME